MRLIPPDGPRRIAKLRRDAQQIVNDIEWWNANRTEEQPFDCGAEKVIVDLCNRGIEAARRKDGDEYSRITEELVAQAQRAVQAFDD